MKDIKFEDKKILIIGDLILEEYILGSSTTLSYEAPIPIVKREITEYQLGASGNLAHNIISLGGSCDLISIIGEDPLSPLLKSNLKNIGIPQDSILNVKEYPNNLDTRIISGGKHVARISNPIRPLKYKNEFIEFLSDKLNNIKEYSLIIIQDNGTFFIDDDIIDLVLSITIKENIDVIFDISNIIKSNYKLKSLASIKLLRTNLNYLKFVGGIPFELDLTKEELEKLCIDFVNITEIDSLVVTLGSGGLIYVEKEIVKLIEGYKVYVFDVTGAGNSLLATIALCMTSNIDLDTTLELANISGHISCRYIGSTPVELVELMEAYKLLTQSDRT